MQPPAFLRPAVDPGPGVAFGLGLALVFLRFSMLHQVQHYLVGVNLRLLYVFGIPAILGLLAAGGIPRSFKGRPAFYWSAFVFWIALSSPFSLWRAHSVSILLEYLRTNLVMLFIIAGLTLTWRQCKSVMFAIACGGVVNLLTARFFQGSDYGARLSLDFGTVADPNDFAAHLLLVLPFLLWVVFTYRSVVLRACMLLGVCFGLYLILRTASRGAVLGISVELLFFLFRGSMRQRIALLVVAPLAAVALLAVVPQSALTRLRSFSEGGPNKEAVMSTESREYLFRKSVAYTLEHPIFGVGPGEFSEYEGERNRLPGMTHGYWHETHNTFTQVSSECGIPAALFFIAGVGSSFWLLNSTFRRARKRPEFQEIRNTAFCVMMGFAGFCTAVTFLNFAYLFYFPAIGGLAIAIHFTARKEFEAKAGGAPAATLRLPAPPLARSLKDALARAEDRRAALRLRY